MTPVLLTLLSLTLARPAFALQEAKQEAAKQEAPKYTAEEYKAYQGATGEADPAKKLDLILAFLKDRPASTLRQHVIAAYQGMLSDLQTGQKWSDMVATGEKFLAAVPDDLFTVSLLTEAYQRTGNQKQFVAFGEKVYAQKASDNLAYFLAMGYLQLKNDAKFFEWGEKAAAAFPDKYEISCELMQRYATAQKVGPSVKYARSCVKALQTATKPEGLTDADWKSRSGATLANSYAVIGSAAFNAKDWPGSITNLEAALRYNSRNQVAYYQLAQAYWQQSKLDMAMKNFAKAYVLGGSVGAAAKQHLDNLYKSTHQNSLVGQERVIAKAKSELPVR